MQELTFNEENYKFDLYSPRQLKSLLFFDKEEEEEQASEGVTFEETTWETGSAGAGPEIVAILAAALIAGGLMDKRSVITAVRPDAEGVAWRKAGLRDLMICRDLNSFR